MRTEIILKLATEFLSIANSEELPEDSNDLNTILKNLDALETFAARKKYAEQNLKHLSSGSSRIIYEKDNKAIKLAKNEKGVAQNKIEAKPDMKSKYINGADKSSKHGYWIVARKLDKITEKEFKEATGINFKDFGEALYYLMKNISGDKEMDKPENYKEISESVIFEDVAKLAKKHSLLPGDLSRISSWGLLDNHPILADAGLTRKIYDDFYDDANSSSST